MAKPDLKVLNLLCPHRTCGAAMVQDECGIFCRACGYEAITWADPVDADVPMDILVARETAVARRKMLMRGVLAAAALVALISLAWIAWPATATAETFRNPAEISFAEMKEHFGRGKLPEHLDLPNYYEDVELFVMKRERSAQSVLVPWWNQRTRDEKLQLLDSAIDAESLDLLPFVLEISWFTSAQEQDQDIAVSMLQALYSGGKSHVEVAWFVCDHVASSTPLPTVRTNALRYVADLNERRRQLGR